MIWIHYKSAMGNALVRLMVREPAAYTVVPQARYLP